MSDVSHYGKYRSGLYGLPHMGEVIADYRVKRGWKSQGAFAIVCGVDRQTVAYWEKLEYLAEMKRRIFLCKVLRIPPMLLGLTWRSILDDAPAGCYADAPEHIKDLLHENAYGLYEDILMFAHTSLDRYSMTASYRFYKHLRELEELVHQSPGSEKENWQDLLSRFHQHAINIAQHHEQDAQALGHAEQAVELATSLQDKELLSSALYRRSRVHLTQHRHNKAREDIQAALSLAEHARGPLKGSCYLLRAEIEALFGEGDEKIKLQCRKWQDAAANLIYKGKVEPDETFLTFSLYAVHHERAKTLTRFALYHTTDDELVALLKQPHRRAKKELLRDAQESLLTAEKHLQQNNLPIGMYLPLTEAKCYLVDREFEKSAKTAKQALQYARVASSQQGIVETTRLYNMLSELAPNNPYICNLGVELGLY
ncbi:XRE family transcriptional regulator [Ktedonosporobacter rubrisoli]|uniref:XRE family transcriptional regulator n=1 Tax=Ktedonosporobacter rubrisoli TaxID=2509675 RepID=A0A4V0YYC7_KTERU|nr:helix-turn-helix transcriptional regulator [Ktedonosporobacter rubrisoli]QBD75761.1 XRE family transcriptional regulator [Ktedonosporobacter rubrisoli]